LVLANTVEGEECIIDPRQYHDDIRSPEQLPNAPDVCLREPGSTPPRCRPEHSRCRLEELDELIDLRSSGSAQDRSTDQTGE
jgi:hypothetical protein